MKSKFGLRHGVAGLTAIAAAVFMLFAVAGALANPVSGAISTTDNPGWPDSYDAYVNTACLNGQGVNCNIYNDKRDVWFSGLPVQASLGAGTYFFAVLSPGGQPNPNDCAPLKNNGDPANLSDTTPCETTNTGAGDTWQSRRFSVDGSGNITYSGPHDFDSTNNKIQVFPYDDTPNPGGVYILAVCKLPSSPTPPPGGPGVAPRDCKYDAFKVRSAGPPPTTPPASGATLTKDASGGYDNTYTWGITKRACAHGVTPCTQTVDALSGNVRFDYTVTLTEDGGTPGNIKVTGTISVFNPNFDVNDALVPMTIDSLTDSTSDGTSCTVTGAPSGGGTVTLNTFETDFLYECDYTSLPATPLSNTVTVHWPDQDLNLSVDASNLSHLDAGVNDFTFGNISFTASPIGNCVTVTDDFNGAVTPDTLGTFCADGTDSGVSSNPVVTPSWSEPTWTLNYSRSVPVVADACKAYKNTATFSGADVTSGLSGTGQATVNVCGPASGGLTMGFWQNKNGQGIITGQAKTGVCPSGTWLRQFAPYQDLSSTATCAQVATYVYNVIKAASCTSSTKTCNSMLKAQMLATALDVYFSDPALGGDKIFAFNGGNNISLGGVYVDLTKICSMIDGSGGATCSGTENASSVFGGTPTCQTVSQLLTYAASQSNAGGSIWYSQLKPKQVPAKDTFDSINNQKAFVCSP
jgi:hypothetical protein